MTRPCPGPLPPHPPKFKLPPGACDTHVHVLGPYDKCPMSEERGYTAPEAPVETLEAFLATMGIDRVVIAHVTAHGMDMSVTLDAIAALGDRARGVAMLPPDVADAELDRLNAGGIRGARLTPLFGEAVTFDLMADLARRIARLGWHIVFAPSSAEQWLDIAPRMRDLPVDVIVDHMAWRGFTIGGGVDQPGFRAILDMLAADNCWLKLAAPHRFSGDTAPYPDLRPYVRALTESRADGLVWGTDWPHVRVWDDSMPEDADLVDWILDWDIDAATQKRILVDNPARLYGFGA